MTVTDLHQALAELIRQGHGGRQVDVMDVEQGITYARAVVEAIKAQEYDGDMVWLLTEKRRGPEWMR